MKNFLIAFFSVLTAMLCAGEASALCAWEDFSRFEPGQYDRGRKAGVWTIVEEDGRKILRAGPDVNVLYGWSFLDLREIDYGLRLRFRLADEKTGVKFRFHEPADLKTAEFFFSHYELTLIRNKAFLFCKIPTHMADANKGKKNPVPLPPETELRSALRPGVWYELEFRVRSESIESELIHPDGVREPLIRSPLNPGGGVRNRSLSFTGRADVDWVKSFFLPVP